MEFDLSYLPLGNIHSSESYLVDLPESSTFESSDFFSGLPPPYPEYDTTDPSLTRPTVAATADKDHPDDSNNNDDNDNNDDEKSSTGHRNSNVSNTPSEPPALNPLSVPSTTTTKTAGRPTAVDRNNKRLGFSPPMYNFTLLDYSLRRVSLSLTAQLHGMFFLAESPWALATGEGDQEGELTCYRRNLFQVGGTITLPRGLRYIMTDQGDRVPILALELTVSATESVEGNLVKVISVPWKTPTNVPGAAGEGEDPPPTAPSSSSSSAKIEREPSSIPLDTMAGQDLDSDYATFPITWKRLQFRVATANNGRRKELQQHFVMHVNVIATLSTGDKISLCGIQSDAIIVRGRSPRNFSSRKDLPLSGSAVTSRKHAMTAASRTYAKATGMKRVTTSPALSGTSLPSPAGSSWSSPKVLPSSAPLSAPLPYSLSDDDVGTPSSPDEDDAIFKNTKSIPTSLPPPPKMRKVASTPPMYSSTSATYPSIYAGGVPSPMLSSSPGSPLYDYFPLSLDECQSPVDGVYRPHAAHHTSIPDMDYVANRGTKRFFAEDVF